MNFVRLKMKLRKFSLWFYFDLKTIKLMSIYSPWYIQRVDCSSHVQLSYTSAKILGKTIILGRNVRFSKQFITERLRSPFWWATFRPHLLGISAKKMQFSIACRFLHSLSAILIHWWWKIRRRAWIWLAKRQRPSGRLNVNTDSETGC